ncbi:MAG: hypothetical protein ACYDH5_07190 [Acidimicrobiales bacterium]
MADVAVSKEPAHPREEVGRTEGEIEKLPGVMRARLLLGPAGRAVSAAVVAAGDRDRTVVVADVVSVVALELGIDLPVAAVHVTTKETEISGAPTGVSDDLPGGTVPPPVPGLMPTPVVAGPERPGPEAPGPEQFGDARRALLEAQRHVRELIADASRQAEEMLQEARREAQAAREEAASSRSEARAALARLAYEIVTGPHAAGVIAEVPRRPGRDP